MKLKITIPKDKKHTETVTCIAWSSADEVISTGDDHKILKWNLVTGESFPLAALAEDVFPTDVSISSSHTKTGKSSSEVFVVTSTDGKFHIFNMAGRLERSVDAHKGAVLSGKWSNDGSALLTAGEDGQIKIWSRSGMLRSTLAQLPCCIYSVVWSPESDHVLYTNGRQLVIKPLQPSAKPLTWKAHDGVILKVDWNSVNNLILSGGEDCKYKIWDSYGRPLYSSGSHDYPITSISWSPDGNLFTVGSFNMLRLCDKSGWSHCLEKPSTGSLLNISWSADGTQIAAASADGHVVLSHCIEKRLEWCEFEVTLTGRKTIEVRNVVNDAHETLELRDRVIKMSLAYKHLVVVTSSQCLVYSTSNFNTPSIFDLREGNIAFIQQSEKNFLIADHSGLYINSYEGRQICSPKLPGGTRGSTLSNRILSLGPDVLAVRDPKNDRSILLYDTTNGKLLGDGAPIQHTMEIIEVHVSQCGPTSDRFLAVIDKNHDLYLNPVRKTSTNHRLTKLASMVQSLRWNSSVNILCGLRDTKLLVWFYPRTLFVDKDILPQTLHERECSEFGKNPELCDFHESTVTVRRADGSICSISNIPYPTMLHRLVATERWNEAVRLCRFAKLPSLWACLAAMTLKEKDLATAEIAYAAIGEVDKVEYLKHVKSIPSKEVRRAELTLLSGSVNEAEAVLIQGGFTYRAIQLNLDLFRWERALELAVKHKTHVDTVLGFRELYLQQIHKQETSNKFKQYSKGVDINWENIHSKIEMELANE
uniref:Anaphase-promoting complex subunit 4 WD40 domain-containing protein n=1 Tax=Ciona savignyi TaxID=51511 RepID=H2ZBZ1_CIOSA